MNFTVDIAGIIALIGVAITLFKTFKLTNNEVKEGEATIFASMAQTVSDVAEHNKVLVTRVLELENSVMKMQHDTTRNSNIMAKWARGIKLLLSQLKELKVEPCWAPELDDLVESDK